MEKRWNIQQADDNTTTALQAVLKVNISLCGILVQRGIDDFEKALLAEESRKLHQNLPPFFICPEEVFHYKEMAKFTKQVQRFFDVFGKENVLVIIFDDFIKDTKKIFAQTLEFLNIENNFLPEFKIINPNKRIISRRFNEVLRKLSPSIITASRIIIPSKKIRKYLFESLQNINTRYTKRKDMSGELRKKLQVEFFGEVQELTQLLGRDLTYWCKD